MRWNSSTKNTIAGKRIDGFFLLIIMVLAAALRIYHYAGFSLSNDELSALNRLHFSTFHDLVYKGFYVDGHPGGIQVFLWYWVKLFGETEASLRLPFVLVGITAVWMAYKVGGRMFGKTSGLFSAAALAFLPFPLLYSQIARPYISGMLFCLMLIWFWLQIFFDKENNVANSKPRLHHLAGFTISAALCMYNHYFSFLFALLLGISGFAFARRQNILPYIGASLVAALLFMPHIPITVNHLTYKGVGLWLGVPGRIWILEHIYYALGMTLFMLAIILAITTALLFRVDNTKAGNRFRWLLASWFLLPVLIGYVYSVQINPVLQHPVLIFSFPCLIMLIFSFGGDKLTGFKKILLTVFIVAGTFNTVFLRDYYHEQHFGEFRETARLTALYNSKLSPDSITSASVVNSPFYLKYYLDRFGSKSTFDLNNVEGSEGLQQLADQVKTSTKPYFLFAVTKPAPDGCEDIIRSRFPGFVEYRDYGGLSSFTLFARTGGKSFAEAHNLLITKHIEADLPLSEFNRSGNRMKAFSLASGNEFSPGIEIQLTNAVACQGTVIQASAELFVDTVPSNSVLVLSVELPCGKSIRWQGIESKYAETKGEWFHLYNTINLNQNLPKDSKLKVYIWNRNRLSLYINKLECTLYAPAPISRPVK